MMGNLRIFCLALSNRIDIENKVEAAQDFFSRNQNMSQRQQTVIF